MHDVYVIGGLVLDLSEEFDRYPEEGEEVFSPSFSSVIGGTAYNISQGFLRNGITPILSAYIGDDFIGEMLSEGLRQREIDTHLVKVKGAGTGVVFSVLTPNDRTMFTYRGADSLFSITDEMLDIAKTSKITCISSYIFMGKDSIEKIRDFFQKIKWDTKIALSMAKGVLDMRFSWIVDVLSDVDIIFANNDEYSEISRYIKPGQEVVVTMGEDGARYIKGGETLFCHQNEKVKKGRFTGAGDLFCAGFLSGRLKGLSPADSLALGNATSLSWIRYEFG